MPADKVAEAVQKAQEAFRSELTENYELDDEFVQSLADLFTKYATPLANVAPKRSRVAKTGAEKPRRKKSAYNLYVREQMASEAVKHIAHRDKMGFIANLWANASDEEKAAYKSKAEDENSSALEAEETA